MIVLFGNGDDGGDCRVASKVITGQGQGNLAAASSTPVNVFGASLATGDSVPYSGQLIFDGNVCQNMRLQIAYLVGGDCDSCNDPDVLTTKKMTLDVPKGTKVWGLPNAYIVSIDVVAIDVFGPTGVATPSQKAVTATYTSQYTLGCCAEVVMP